MHPCRNIAAFLLLALLMANNLHLPLLQVAAWSGMMVSYSRDNTVADAITMTFDGEHPCAMCKSIEKVQTTTAEQAQPDGLQGSSTRDLCGLLAMPKVFIPPAFTHQRVDRGSGLGPQHLSFPPPNPPPICA